MYGDPIKNWYFNSAIHSILDTFNLSFKEINNNYFALKKSPHYILARV